MKKDLTRRGFIEMSSRLAAAAGLGGLISCGDDELAPDGSLLAGHTADGRALTGDSLAAAGATDGSSVAAMDGASADALDGTTANAGIAERVAEGRIPEWKLGLDSSSPHTMLMFRGNPARTFYGIGPVPEKPRLKWKVQMPTKRIGYGDDKPARFWGGTGWTGQPVKWGPRLYIGSQNFNLYALDAESGRIDWIYGGGRMFKSSCCYYRGRLYSGNVDNNVHCVDADTGKKVWTFATPTDVDSSPCVADGRLYVGGECGFLHCLDPKTGKLFWKRDLGGHEGPPGSNGVESSPAVKDGRVYAGNFSGDLFCLDAKTGDQVWKARTGGDTDASPVAFGEFVFAAAEEENPKVFCFAAEDGREIWSVSNRAGWWSTPAVKDGRVYIGGQDKKMYCLDARTGRLEWTFTAGEAIWSSPCVVDDKVLFGSYDRNLYLLDAATGRQIWSFQTSERVLSTACVVGGNFWVGNSGGDFYCFTA